MENLGLPLQVFILGLLTVFIVLLIVVLTGKGIIWAVNRFFPLAKPPEKKGPEKGGPTGRKPLAAIAAAVQAVTEGHGKVVNIRKT